MKKSELGQKAMALGEMVHAVVTAHLEELKALQHETSAPWTVLVARQVWAFLLADEPVPPEAQFVEGTIGMLGPQEHAWIELSLPPEESGERDFRFIIDPCVPDVHPNILVISPRSPMKQLYRKVK